MVTRAFRSGSRLAIVTAAITFCQFLPPAAPAQESESRTWRDATGVFSVEAKLVERTATEVKLRTSAGKEVSVPIARLSEDDVEYLKTLSSTIAPVAVATPPGPELMTLGEGAETASNLAFE